VKNSCLCATKARSPCLKINDFKDCVLKNKTLLNILPMLKCTFKNYVFINCIFKSLLFQTSHFKTVKPNIHINIYVGFSHVKEGSLPFFLKKIKK
jgi:hypothetical protein